MGHRKWGHYAPIKGQPSLRPTCIDEHNALYDAWSVERDRAGDLLKDRNTIQGKLDEARKRIAELESPIRVPFTDAQIDAMAREASYSINGWGYRCWDENSGMTRDAWRDSVRRALAAGGLEPCAVPEYDPDDVALRPTGHVLRDRLVEAEAKIENQRAELKRLNALVADLRAEVDEDNAAAASVNDLLVQVQNLTAERGAQEIELADLRFYQREFAAVSAERDALRERASVPVKVRWDVSAEKLACEAKQMFVGGARDTELARRIMDYLAAHAVIAHLYTRPEGLPTAEDIKYLPGKPHVFNNELLIAAYKALKTRHALEWDDETNKDGWQRVVDVVRNATYETLRPWLRDPVGFELDVTWREIEDIYCNTYSGKSTERDDWQAILDLCRSRIRPVFECKECAKMKGASMAYIENIEGSCRSARAALEGE